MICMEFVLCSPESWNIKCLYSNPKIQKHNNAFYTRDKIVKHWENNGFENAKEIF